MRSSYNFFAYSLAILIACLWFYGSAGLHFNAYNNFAVYATDDISDYNQAAWNTAHGRLFRYNDRYAEERILAHQDTTTTALHSNFIFLLIALPYLLLPHFSSFMLLQSVFLAASIFALYILCRQVSGEKKVLPLLVTLVYSVYFPFIALSHFFHPEPFSIFFIFLALYFYWRDKLGLTLIFCALAILCREEISLAFALLGMVSYFIPGKRKYFLPLLLTGILSFLFIKAFLTRYVTAPLLLEGHYGYLGRTFAEKIKNLIFNPGLMISNILKPDRMAIFRDIFATLLYLPFLAPLLLLPGGVILAEVMLSSSWSMGTLRWQPWYLCPLIPFIFLAFIAALEKIYTVREKLSRSKIVRAVPLALIAFIFFYTYIHNSILTRSSIKAFNEYFSVQRYWRDDTFTVLSGINKQAKVACSLKLIPMLSSRRYVLPQDKLTQKILNQGFYDVIILSEGDYLADTTGYAKLVESVPLYQRVYYTPYLDIFTRKGVPSLLRDWRFSLISEIRDSRLAHNYVIKNFTDFSAILETSGIISPEELVNDFYRNSRLHHAILLPINPGQTQDTLYFVADKPLEKNSTYLLVFAARTENNADRIYVRKPTDRRAAHDEIKIDGQLRLFVLPFRARRDEKLPIFIMQMNNRCSILKPVLLKSPLGQAESPPILKARIGNYTMEYNPWPTPSRYKQAEFLKRHITPNPLLYFIRACGFSMPQDLYRYFWVSARRGENNIIAVRYR